MVLLLVLVQLIRRFRFFFLASSLLLRWWGRFVVAFVKTRAWLAAKLCILIVALFVGKHLQSALFVCDALVTVLFLPLCVCSHQASLAGVCFVGNSVRACNCVRVCVCICGGVVVAKTACVDVQIVQKKDDKQQSEKRLT